MNPSNQIPMDLETQKRMAFDGVRTWAAATVRQAERMQKARDDTDQAMQRRFSGDLSLSFIEFNRQFAAERMLFLDAAALLVAHSKWAREVNVIDRHVFSELNKISGDIESLRGQNFHVIDYFKGGGKHRKSWISENDSGSADASSTMCNMLGNRLDYIEASEIASRILNKIPLLYINKDPDG